MEFSAAAMEASPHALRSSSWLGAALPKRHPPPGVSSSRKHPSQRKFFPSPAPEAVLETEPRRTWHNFPPRKKPSPHKKPVETAPSPEKENFALRGNFRPVIKEQASEVGCQVAGRIPEELKGRLLRNGPNPLLPPDPKSYHWFDGDGMVHSVRLDGPSNRAYYQSAWVRTAGFLEEKASQGVMHRGMLGGWGPENWRVLLSKAAGLRLQDSPWWNGQKNTSNTHLVEHSGRLLSLSEGGYPYELDVKDLSTKGLHMFGGALRSNFTAHPKVDPRTGEMMYIGYNLVTQPHLHYGVVAADGHIVHHADIRLPAPVMMHDFGITPRYTVLPDFPIRFQMKEIVASQGKAKPFAFDARVPGRIGVLPRFGQERDVKWFHVANGACMHFLNAYEDVSDGQDGQPPGSTTVVLQGFRFDAIQGLGTMEVKGSDGFDETCRLHEWRLHLPSGTATERPLCDVCSDFPALDRSKLGTRTRYGFSARFVRQPGPGSDPPAFDGVLKHDLATGGVTTHFLGPRQWGHEPVFVPRRAAATSAVSGQESEALGGGDDGWLLVHVFDEEAARSEVLILDARGAMEEIARITVPGRVPYGFHGMFVGDK